MTTNNEAQVDTNNESGQKPPDEEVRIVGWTAAVDHVGCSMARLRRLAAGGELPAQRDQRGRVTFLRRDLERIRAQEAPAAAESTSPGTEDVEDPPPPAPEADAAGISASVYADVFADLTSGKTLDAIVSHRKLLPEVVARIARQWRELREVDVNAPTVLSDISALRAEMQQHGREVAAINIWAKQVGIRLGGLVTANNRISEGFAKLLSEMIASAIARQDARMIEVTRDLVSSDRHWQNIRELVGMIATIWGILRRLAPLGGLTLPETPCNPEPETNR